MDEWEGSQAWEGDGIYESSEFSGVASDGSSVSSFSNIARLRFFEHVGLSGVSSDDTFETLSIKLEESRTCFPARSLLLDCLL